MQDDEHHEGPAGCGEHSCVRGQDHHGAAHAQRREGGEGRQHCSAAGGLPPAPWCVLVVGLKSDLKEYHAKAYTCPASSRIARKEVNRAKAATKLWDMRTAKSDLCWVYTRCVDTEHLGGLVFLLMLMIWPHSCHRLMHSHLPLRSTHADVITSLMTLLERMAGMASDPGAVLEDLSEFFGPVLFRPRPELRDADAKTSGQKSADNPLMAVRPGCRAAEYQCACDSIRRGLTRI